MNDAIISLGGEKLTPCPSGALHWSSRDLLVVSDLHLGKSERIARLGGAFLPPYECEDTLIRLEDEIARTRPSTIICLGDSFDDRHAASALSEATLLRLTRLQAGRNWIWIEGNHDPGPVGLGGSHLSDISIGGLEFRHIARAGATGEISGHFHPKAELFARGRKITRRCFLFDEDRLIMPAFGTYTGGLGWQDPALQSALGKNARAALLGREVQIVPVPRAKREAGPMKEQRRVPNHG